MSTAKPKIVIDARMYGAEQTGIGKYIARLLQYVPPLMPEAEFVVFMRQPEFGNFMSPHLNVKKRKTSAYWYGYKEQALFPAEIASEKPDLVHFPHFNVPLLYRGKFIVTIHDLTPHSFPGPKMNSFWRRSMFRLVFGHALRASHEVIAVSQYTKSDILKRFGKYVLAEKIHVLYEGVDEEFLESGDRSESVRILNDKYGIARPFILYTGVWREHKNITGLVEAYAMLRNKYKQTYDLVLCGKEQLTYPEPRLMWERLGMGHNVKCPGFIPQEDLRHFYRAAALTVIPSFAEGFGFIGLESLACGTPVASSNTTSLPEVLRDAAAYFDPHSTAEMADAMNRILSDSVLRNGLLTGGRRVVSSYDWHTTARATAECYGAVLDAAK
jgi:glycosyltransferase involved in cell wall biosynthesis